MARPKVNSESQKELDRAESSFETFQEQLQSLTLDTMNKAPLLETEPQVKQSTREMNKADAPYIKPLRSINSKEPFNEKYRQEHTEAWKYVKCVVENLEIIGESIEMWTKRFAGDAAHFWRIPVNKPVYIPRLVAEQLTKCSYHRLSMESQVTGTDSVATYVGSMVVDNTKQRLNARPVGNGFITL